MKEFLIRHWKFLIPAVALAGLVVNLLIVQNRPVVGQTVTRDGITMLKPSVPDVSLELEYQVIDQLKQDAAERGIFTYAITSVDQRGGYTLVSVAGFSSDQAAEWSVENALWLGSVTLAPGGKGGIVEDAMNSSAPAPSLPDASQAKSIQGGGASPILPWRKGTMAIYGELGVHDCGFSLNGWKAVDMFPQEAQVYASLEGEVSYVCRDATQMSIRVGDMMYVHLVDTGLKIGDHLSQGQLISSLVPGTFNATCGYASQNPGSAHVHWCFLPYNNTFQADGYTLNTSTGQWTKGGTTYNTGDSLLATWESADASVPPPSAMGSNFWDSLVAGIFSPIGKFINMFPTHTNMGIADKTMTSAIPTLQLIYPFISLFNMTVIMWVIAIVLVLEAVRIVVAIVLWVKKILPDIIGLFI